MDDNSSASLYLAGTIIGVIVAAFGALLPFFLVLFASETLLNLLQFSRSCRFLLMMLRSLRRNLLRTSLTYLATFILVLVVTMVWSILDFLNHLTEAKTASVKLIVSEKWQADSRMPFSYARPLSEGAASPGRPGDMRPMDSMTWQFYVGTLDPVKKTRESYVFLIALEPSKLLTMMEDIMDDLDPRKAKHLYELEPNLAEKFQGAVREMENDQRSIIVGRKQLQTIKKQVGDRFTLTGLNYAGIDLEFKIVGAFPPGRYDDAAVMNRDYLNNKLDYYPKEHKGAKHPLADKALNLVWLKVPNKEVYSRVAEQIEASSMFRDPVVKCETLSSELTAALEPYRDLFWAMRWLLSPALLVTMAVVISNAISLSVRERRGEMAVLKVLGFRPVQILGLVLGEAMLIGAISGLLSSGMTFLAIDFWLGDHNDFIVWVPPEALLWGPGIGAITAVIGSLAPAWTAGKVKVSEVFARIG
jgi:putative ABC transport system permease protein